MNLVGEDEAARMTFGVLSYDVAHLLGGAALLASFALLCQRRAPALIGLYVVQAITLALAAAWQGWVQAAPGLLVTAAVTLLGKVLLIPIGLRRIAADLAPGRDVEAGLGVFPGMAMGLALVVLAVLSVLPVTAAALTREDLALSLSVVLLGMAMMLTCRSALAQVIGFLSLENGLILAAIGVSGLPLVVELSVAALVLVACVVFGALILRIGGPSGTPRTLDTIDLDRLLHGRE